MEKKCTKGKELLAKTYSVLEECDKIHGQTKSLLNQLQKCVLKRQKEIMSQLKRVCRTEPFKTLDFDEIGNWRSYPLDFYVETENVCTNRGMIDVKHGIIEPLYVFILLSK